MRIVIDGRMIGWTGIGRYIRELVKGLAEIDQDTDYRVLLQPSDAKNWRPPGKNFRAEIVEARPFSWGEQSKLTQDLLGLRPDLVHFTNFNLPVRYKGQYVVTIPDLTLINFQNIAQPGPWAWLKYQPRYWAMRLVVWRAAKRSRAVITLSRFVKNQLSRRYHLHPIKVQITPLGDDAPTGKVTQSPLKHPYLLYVGNPYPHKNLNRLIEAFKTVGQEFPDLKLVLVCHPPVGNIERFYQKLRQQVTAAGLDETVIFPEFIPSEQMANWFAHAKAYVFPSLSEGFGLPAVGAMAQGTPVIAANATCLPEVCGSAAIYFDPLDPADITKTIVRLLSDDKLQSKLRAAGLKQAARYDWRHMAEQTLAVYRSVLK